MAIERHAGGGMTITGDSIAVFRLLTLWSGLKLETKGMGRRGRSCYAIVKSEYSFKGNKKRVFDLFDARLRALGIVKEKNDKGEL